MPLLPRRRSKRVPFYERERIGHEEPGAVLRGPPISVKCECGEKKDLAYGETWECEACGRRWNTNQIPPEQYQQIRNTQLRFRVVPVCLGLLVSSVTLFFIATHNVFSVFILLPLSMMIWFFFIRPFHRRRYHAAIADLPRWELHPE